MIVPTVNLLTQGFNDFLDYNNNKKNIKNSINWW